MRPVAIAVGRPVHLFQFRILTQCLVANAALQEELKFFPAWISGRAAVARNRKGAASIGEFQAGRPVFAPQPTAKQAGHEPVARAQHIKDLDGKPLTALSLVEIVGYFSFENHRAHRPTLAYERRFRRLTYGPERLQRIGRAACYVEFFFRADDQVEKMQRRLQFGCNGLAFDEAVFTVAMAGKPPEIGAEINIEGCATSVFAGKPQRFQYGCFCARMRQMRTGGEQATGFRDEIRVDIVFAKSHIGTILAIEDKRKCS